MTKCSVYKQQQTSSGSDKLHIPQRDTFELSGFPASLSAAEHFLKCPHIFRPRADHEGNTTVKEVETTFQRHTGRNSNDSSQGTVPFITFSLDSSSIKGKMVETGA